MATLIGAVASVIVGGVIAAATVIGVVSNSVDSGGSKPDNVAQSIDYGSTR